MAESNSREKEMAYTLIKGSSMGIGKAFAIEGAKKRWNLLLVALPWRTLMTVPCPVKKKRQNWIDPLCLSGML